MSGSLEPVSGASPSAARRPRVLVAEDDLQMRQLVADVLRREGCHVEELADGEQLLARIVSSFMPHRTDKEIDLIVSDVRMPFCSGLDILKKLRAGHRTTPVLLMTAFGDPWLRGRVRELGGVLLDKPFTLLALRAAVRELLSAVPVDDAAPSAALAERDSSQPGSVSK